MRVLVTGAAGFIGSALTTELAARDIETVAYDMPSDVRDAVALDRAVRHVDGVVNLAGVLGTTEILGAERTAAGVNVVGAVNVLDTARRYDVPVVQIGTGHEGQPNPYAITKRCATDLALSRAWWTGQPVNVVRAFHAYGPGQKPCAPHGSSTVRKIIPSFICRALAGEPVQVFGSGHQLIDLVHVTDVARVLADALNEPYGFVLEAGTGKATSVLNVATDVLSAVDPALLERDLVQHLPMRLGEPPESAVVALNPECHNAWPYLLPETVDWYRQHLQL